MKKGWLIGCGCAGVFVVALCAGIVAISVGGVLALTKPVTDASTNFLAQLEKENFDEAYDSLSVLFHVQLDKASFIESVKHLGLTDYSSVSWTNRQLNNSVGTTEGTVTTKAGGKKPISVVLNYEQGKWKILRLIYGGANLEMLVPVLPLPAEADVEELVKDSLLSFNEAVQAKDFTAFYNGMSESFKNQTSAAKIQAAFQSFIDKSIDISRIKETKPEFTSPAAINPNGRLVVAGYFPIQPSAIQFEITYTPDHGEWKLFGIFVNAAPPTKTE